MSWGGAVALGGDVFAFLANIDAADQRQGYQRVAVGSVAAGTFARSAVNFEYQVERSSGVEAVGYGSSLCVTPDGDYTFLGGWYLQVSTDGADFEVVADPTGQDTEGCPAWDVVCSDSVVAFKTAQTHEQATSTTIGYVLLAE